MCPLEGDTEAQRGRPRASPRQAVVPLSRVQQTDTEKGWCKEEGSSLRRVLPGTEKNIYLFWKEEIYENRMLRVWMLMAAVQVNISVFNRGELRWDFRRSRAE